MSQPSRADEALSECVARMGYQASPHQVRDLREYGVIETLGSHKGGRGQVAEYVPGSCQVVAAVEAAKADPSYRRKLPRAILIAWARRASIGTPGLRWAFEQHYKAEIRNAQHLVHGKRVEDEDEIALPPEWHRALGAALLGYPRSADDLGSFETSTGSIIRDAFWQSGQRNLLQADSDALGLADRRDDGSWHVFPTGEEFWEALALEPQRRIARTAPRKELEAALPRTERTAREHGFNYSPLVLATTVPITVRSLRERQGERWWQTSPEP